MSHYLSKPWYNLLHLSDTVSRQALGDRNDLTQAVGCLETFRLGSTIIFRIKPNISCLFLGGGLLTRSFAKQDSHPPWRICVAKGRVDMVLWGHKCKISSVESIPLSQSSHWLLFDIYILQCSVSLACLRKGLYVKNSGANS